MADPNTIHDLGSNQEGWDGATLYGSPVDNGDYVTFDGTTGLYYGSDYGNESNVGVKIRFRPHDFRSGNSQVLWKSGGNGSGFAAGIVASSHQKVGLSGRSSSSARRLLMPWDYLVNNEWFIIWVSPTKITLQRESTGDTWTFTGSTSVGNGTDPESIGFAKSSSPLTGASGNSDFFDGDIDYVEIWDDYTQMTIPTGDDVPYDIYDIGSNQDGTDIFTPLNSPTDNGDYYTFNGTNQGLYRTTDWGDESKIDIYAKFRPANRLAGHAQTIWKSGGYANAICIGIDSSGNIGVFGRSGGPITSILISSSQYSDNTWYEIYASKTRVSLKNVSTGAVTEVIGSINVSSGSADESIGVGYGQTVISGTASTGDYFEGDIDRVEIWPEGTLQFPSPIISKEITDSGQGSDSVAGVTVSCGISDTGAGLDSPSPSAQLSLADIGLGAESFQISSLCTIEDAGVGVDSDSVGVSFTVSDVGQAVELVSTLASISVSDLGLGSESENVFTSITLIDLGTGIESTLSVVAQLSIADLGSGTDLVSVIKSIIKHVTDSGLAVETVSVSAQVPLAEVGQGIDSLSATVSLSISDVGQFVDAISSILNRFGLQDSGAGTDSVITGTGPVSIVKITFNLKTKQILFELRKDNVIISK